MAKETHTQSPDRYRIPRGVGWANAWKVAAGLGGLGLATSAAGYAADPHRFAFSWLYAFLAVLAIALGCLFFVIIQHMSGAGWSVTTRRIPETFASGLWVLPILFLPVLLVGMDELYRPWLEHSEAAHEVASVGESEHSSSAESILGASVARAQEHGEHASAHTAEAHEAHGAHHTPQHALHAAAIEAKIPFLNRSFFIGRAVAYFLIWALLAWFFVSNSLSQDSTKDLERTKKMQSRAPLATFAFGLSLTFAAFDWMMSLEPAWYSTIFGVQYFAVAMVSGLATIITVAYALRSSGILSDAIHVEHYHDLGKLMFGFMVFWAYISFSQFMLIWYASIPEETTYYHMRWAGGWQTFSLFLAATHFVIPFFMMISRNVKRRIPLLAFGAMWLLVNHILECFWLVMPYATEGEAGLSVHWMDIATVLAIGGSYLAFVLFRMTQIPLIPIGDPRLSRALRHEVV